MPVHDWTKVDPGLFHDFHQGWTIALRNALNSGVLPPDYFALAEQRVQGPIPDVLTLELTDDTTRSEDGPAGVAVAVAPPRTSIVRRDEADIYAAKSNRITIRHRHGEVVAVIEIVSPGNKASRSEMRAFVEKAAVFIRGGVHMLIIDVLPPGKRDPYGIHRAIWEQFTDEDYEPPADRPLTLASYDAGPPRMAYVEPVAVGKTLPDMPLFLKPGWYVHAPLEASYMSNWNVFPLAMQRLLER